jgi:hypothetical protein
MAQSIQTRRLTLALMAQVVLCLSFAPVIGAAAQAAQSQSDSRQHDETPRGNGTMQAARDAANARPEESTEREKSAVRDARRSAASRWRQTVASNRLAQIHAFSFHGPWSGFANNPAAYSSLTPQPILLAISSTAQAKLCQVIFAGQSLQPTGPPMIG